MASDAVVLEVGASPSGQASSATDTSSTTSLFLASVDCVRPVKAIMGILNRFMNGRSLSTSSVSPLFEIARSASCLASKPNSP